VGEGHNEARRRLSVSEAADELGVSVDAIRSRIKRGTIPHIKRGGRVWVLLGTDQGNRPAQDQSETSALTSEVEALREQVGWLRGEVQRKDAILLSMTEAMKALSPPEREAPPEPREAPQTATEEQSDMRVPPEPQEGVQRPWWRRWFGG